MSLKNVFNSPYKAVRMVAPAWEKYLTRASTHVSTRFRFAPSSMSGCKRKLFYSFILADKDDDAITPRAQRIFDAGHGFHEIIQKQLLECGVIEKPEHIEIPFFNKKVRIKCFVDAMVNIDGEYYVLEIKTINTNGFSKLSEPKPDHIDQVHVYMKLLKLKKAILLYYDKNDSSVKEFLVKFDDDVIYSLNKRMSSTIEFVEGGKVPKRINSNPKSFQCMWCDYKNTCHKKEPLNWREIQSSWKEVKSGKE